MKQIILYGLAGANRHHLAIRYFVINVDDGNAIVRRMQHIVNLMMSENPSIEEVYAVDNRYGLRQEYMDSLSQHTIESCAVFKDTLEREGLRII